MPNIPRDKLFVQVALKELFGQFFLIEFFRINCEIYVGPELVDSIDDRRARSIKGRFERSGLGRRIHAPIHNPHTDGFVVMKESYLQGLRLCDMFGADKVVMHAEYDPYESMTPDEWLNANFDIWEWIASSAERHGVTVFIENHREDSPEVIVGMLGHVNSPNIKACFDVGHFNVSAKGDIASLIDLYPTDSIGEVHLSDNFGDSDSHLALGRGNINFTSLFEAFSSSGINPVYTIEARGILGVAGGFRHLKKIGILR